MPTPAELARIVEQYDEAQWFEFLDELDLVSRRRRKRQGEPEPPVGNDRDALAAWIARRHFLVDSGIREIRYLPHDSPADEIRLLEVNDRLAAPDNGAAQVEAIEFGLDVQSTPFRLVVADITDDELEAIETGRLLLPPGWTLDGQTSWGRRA